jgi:phage terminase large subunit-like protein
MRGGDKVWQHVKQGVPLRVEIGPRDLAAGAVSVSRRDLGTPLATMLAVVFFMQMLIIATANLVKAAELISVVFPALPHGRSIVLLATIFGVFNLVATSRVMASVNTALTGTMCAGFLAFFVAVATKSAPPASAVLANPQWRLLLPQAGWAVPLFVNTLRFGEAVPVVVGQFGLRRLSKARLAVVVGSLVPMLLAVGLSVDKNAYVLADHSISGASPERWARAVAAAADAWQADRVVVEDNQGGNMVETVLRAADIAMPIKRAHASKGKSARAEPISILYEAKRVFHIGAFPEMEDQMCGLIAGGGYEGPGRSPDRADALVWALTELMLGKAERVPQVRLL